MKIEAHLAHRRAVVAHQPFGMNAVVPADAIGNEKAAKTASGCRTIGRSANVGRAGEAQVRGVETLGLVTAPGDVEMMCFAIGAAMDAHCRRSDHFLDRSDYAVCGVDGAAGIVSIVDAANGAVGPDLLGDPDDVIDDVGEVILEARHRLRTRV